MRYLATLALVVLAGSAWGQPSCNDMHVVGLEAVDQNGIAKGLFDKMLGEAICIQFDLIEIGAGGAMVDIQGIIQDSNGDTAEICCLGDVTLPGLYNPYVFGPAVPPADYSFTCCYTLDPMDPIGSYTITVRVWDAAGECETPCVPGSWNQLEIEVTGVIPIELSSFEAMVSGQSVTVRWETGSESENLGFFVLRGTSADGDYVRVGEMIPAQGTSSTGATYSLVDQPLYPGVYFYRLEDIATNGASTIHEPVRVSVGTQASWGEVKAAFDR